MSQPPIRHSMKITITTQQTYLPQPERTGCAAAYFRRLTQETDEGKARQGKVVLSLRLPIYLLMDQRHLSTCDPLQPYEQAEKRALE